MAEGAECNDLFKLSSWHLAPANATTPVISNLPSPVPFSDWTCPSLSPQEFMDKLFKQHSAITPFLDISTRHNHLVYDSTILAVHNYGHALPNASPAEEIQHVSGLFPPNSPTFTSNSLAEQLSVLTSSVSRNETGNRSTIWEIVNENSLLHEQKESDGTSLPLSTIPALHLLCEQDTQALKNPLTAEDCHISSFDHDLRSTSVTVGLPLDCELSESGWTAYFDLSSEDWTTSYESILELKDMVGEKGLATKPRRNVSRHREQKVEHSEDSSVASDASSGPERPIGDNCLVAPDFFTGTERNLKRFPDEAAIDGLEASHSRQAKLRRLQNMEIQVPVSLLLEDTATSPLQQSSYGMELPGSEASGKCHDETRSAAMRAPSEWQSAAVKNRIEVLQELVPNGMEPGRNVEGHSRICESIRTENQDCFLD